MNDPSTLLDARALSSRTLANSVFLPTCAVGPLRNETTIPTAGKQAMDTDTYGKLSEFNQNVEGEGSR